MAYLKPQSPLRHKDGDYFYPLTTADQVVMPDGSRLNSVFRHTVRTNITLLVSNWSSNAPYTQTITLDDYIDDLKVDANIIYSGIEETDLELNKAASCLSYIKKNGKNVTFYCLSSKPEIDIPIEISYESVNSIADVTVIDGIKLNFKVLGGINQPTTTVENTIWIQTDDEENIVIENWIFSATEPEAPTDNMVWIFTGTFSNVEFNVLSKNTVQVYPIFAKQYVGGTWVGKTAKSYQNGAWVDWFVYILNKNNLYSGWSTSNTSGFTISTETNGIRVHRGTYYGFCRYDEMVDIRAYKAIKLKFSEATSNICVQIAIGLNDLQTDGDEIGWVEAPIGTPSGVLSLDLSGYTSHGSVRIGLAMRNGNGSYLAEAVWLE